jgi:hypothetical protein
MRHASMLAAVCFAAAGFAIDARAHQEGEKQSGPEPFDCEHLPPNAVTRLPEAVRAFAELECAPNGQLIVAREDWVWRYPASYFDRPFVAAYSPMQSRTEPGPRYFTSLTVEELTGEAATKENESLGKALPNYRTEPPPKIVLRMVATNELGHRFDVYFPMTDTNKGWGAVCAPECSPEMLFMIYKNE